MGRRKAERASEERARVKHWKKRASPIASEPSDMRTRIGIAIAAAAMLAPTAALPAQDERIARLPADARSWLQDEVAYIITDREREAFLLLETIDERKAFIDAFWRRRDPIPATPQNELKDEHYRRLEHADRHFQEIASRAGRRTDRGRMYVILGDPKSREAFDNYNEIFTSELWFYEGDPSKGLPPFFYLLFFKPQDVGEFRLYSPALDTPGALLRGNLAAEPSRALEALFRVSPDLGRASLTFDATGPANRKDPSVPMLGTETMVARIEESPKRGVRTDYVDGWLRYGKRVSADYSFNFVPSRSTFAVLIGPSGARFLQYAVEIDFANFLFETDAERTRYYTTVDVNLEIRDPEGALVLADDKESFIQLSRSQVEGGSGSSFSYQDGLPLVAGDFNVSVILRNRVGHEYTVAERDVKVEAPAPGQPALSDVVLGFQIEEDPAGIGGGLKTFESGGVKVQPATDGLFAIGDTAHAFVQVESAGAGDRVRIALLDGETVVREHLLDAAVYVTRPVDQPLDLSEMAGGTYTVSVQLLREGVLAEKNASLTLSPRTAVPRPAFTARRSFDAGEPGMLAMTLGDQLWSLGRFDEARVKLEAAVAADNPKLPMADWKLAGAYVRSREPDRALALLLPLAGEFPDQYEVVLGLGLSYYLKSELGSAARYLERAAEIRPASTGLLNALGDIYIRLDRPRDARRVLEQSLALDPAQEAIRKQVASLPASR
jgi:GWxTD domain-containing protein